MSKLRSELIIKKELIVNSERTGKEGVVIPIAPEPIRWIVDDKGNIYFKVTSNGFTREQWKKQLRFGQDAVDVLTYVKEAPTNGVTYNVVVQPATNLSEGDCVAHKICSLAEKKGWNRPHWEVACLICDAFRKKDLKAMGGLWCIVTMHQPSNSPDEEAPKLLGFGCDDDEESHWIDSHYDQPDTYFGQEGLGFAFVTPTLPLL